MNSLVFSYPVILTITHIMAGNGTTGSLAIRADGQADCFTQSLIFFLKNTPFLFEFCSFCPGLKKDPPENWERSCVPFGI